MQRIDVFLKSERDVLKGFRGVSIPNQPCGVRNVSEFHTRHFAVVDFLTQYKLAAGVHVKIEIQIGDKLRPADLFMAR